MGLELQLIIALIIIIAFSKVVGHVGQKYLNVPVVFGEIFAGLILGPTAMRFLDWSIFANNANTITEIINFLAAIGVLLLMFIAGLETNIKDILKVGKTAVVTALLGVLLPLLFGFLTAFLFGIEIYPALFIGVVLTATSVSISAQTLMELNALKSKEGMTIMGAAVIDDVLGIIILAFVIAFAPKYVAILGSSGQKLPNILAEFISVAGVSENILAIIITVILMILFFVLAVFIAKFTFEKAFLLAEKMRGNHMITATAILMMLTFAFFAEYIGQVAAITGAYIAGIFIASTNFREHVEKGVTPFSYAFFVPIFFINIGLTANVRGIAAEEVLFVVSIILVAILAKVVGCGVGAKITGFSAKEATRVGVGMISRGEVGLIIVKIGKDAGLITVSQFTAMVLLVLVTTMFTPILLRLVFKRCEKKSTV